MIHALDCPADQTTPASALPGQVQVALREEDRGYGPTPGGPGSGRTGQLQLLQRPVRQPAAGRRPLLRVEVADRPAGSVVTVSGEVDTVTSPQLAELLQPLLMASPLVEIDMAGVTFINTAGVRVLLGARQTAVSFRILNPSHQVRRVLEVCEIAEYLGVEAPPGLD